MIDLTPLISIRRGRGPLRSRGRRGLPLTCRVDRLLGLRHLEVFLRRLS
jgi:hypothetical protein